MYSNYTTKLISEKELTYLKMASVAVGISCTEPLGGKQGNFAVSYRSLSAQHLYIP
jgi:hypothetical protein